MKVLALNISEKKGTIKKPVPSVEVNMQGIVGDAHAGDHHRQISLLAQESIKRFESVLGRPLSFGEFAENITTEGFDLLTLKVGDKLQIGEVLMQVTQIGKECHGHGCAIFTQVGKCVMPKEGIFCRVLSVGKISVGDALKLC